tara:strand:- start:422 stop:976 length:555 start_codon:yes stop_codon:yes gene_type:complete
MSTTIYCAYLTVYSGDKLPRRYIGSTNTDKIRKGYNGSVSSQKYGEAYSEEQKSNKHLFSTKILSTHTTRQEALAEELRLQIKYDVVNDSNYYNMSLASGCHGLIGKSNYRYGKGHLVAGKNNPMYKVDRPVEWKQNHSSFMKGNQHAKNNGSAHKRLHCISCRRHLSISWLHRHSCENRKEID